VAQAPDIIVAGLVVLCAYVLFIWPQ